MDLTGKGLVQFEGTELPRMIKGLEHVPFWDDYDLELKDWVLDLHYCWGRERSLKSGKVRRFVRRVRDLILKHQAATQAHLLKAFDGLTPPEADEIIAEWLSSLDVMEEKARSVGVCRWTVHPTEEEIDRNIDLTMAFLTKATGKTPEFAAQLRWLPREEQLKSLARISDGLSQPRPGLWPRMLSRLKLRLRSPA
jgi:hypothetical protein